MAYRVEWSQRAVEDLDAIAQYIALDSTAYAHAVVKLFSTPPVISHASLLQAGLSQSSVTNAFANGLRIVTESSIELRIT
jgi:toxin ParE1/3/4